MNVVPPRPDLGGWSPMPAGPSGTPPARAIGPRWRRASVGWVLLHLAIGFAWAFGLLVVAFMLLLSSGRTSTQIDTLDARGQSAFGGAFWLLLLGTEIGWLLFVYVRRAFSVRLPLFVGVAGAGFVVSVSILFRTVLRLG